MTTYKVKDDTGNQTQFALPNIIPELTYHIGLKDDLEIGGRVALGSLALEGDVKYRLVHSGPLHVAIAPAIGYQALGSLQAGTLRLPGIVTYELSDAFAINLAAFGSTTHYSGGDETNSDFGNFQGDLAAFGAAAGLEIRGEVFAIRPSIEWTDFAARLDQDNFKDFSTVNVMVHLAWIGGREKKQLDRIENKLDKVLDKPPSGTR